MITGCTRRGFVKCAALAAASTLAGCGGGAATAALRERARRLGAGLDCSDVSALQPAEARTRTDNAYRQHTERDDQFCLGCLNFEPNAVETACGACKTVRGPINPDGWCKQWTKAK
jgi:hypothetical protein